MVNFDINLSTGHWPFRPLPLENLPELVAHLRAHGISGGLVRSAEVPFSADPEAENCRLFERCRAFPSFTALPAVHPDYGFWQRLTAPAVALYPGFHGYSLLEEKVLQMAKRLAASGTIPFVVMREEDERSQHLCCRVPEVPAAEVEAFALALPATPVVALNGYTGEFGAWKAPNLYADIAFAESFPGLRGVLDVFPAERLLFGSHAPFFCIGGAISKVERENFAPEQLINHAKRIFHESINLGY